MLRAEELMVGDWVQNPHGLKGRVRSIKYIPKDNADNYGGYSLLELVFSESTQTFPINDAKPIPITPEILEKNGFKDVSSHTLKGCETYELSFGRDYDQKIIYKLRDYFQYWSFDDRWYKLFETQICHKWCVHELQHALRLRGIDKTIEL